jgi:hypothetical protein
MYDHKEAVGPLTGRQHALEQQFVVSHPHGWFPAFEYTIDRPRGEVWIEPANRIESCIATNSGPLAHLIFYDNARSVVVDSPSKAVSIVRVSESVPPHPAEACNRHQHDF